MNEDDMNITVSVQIENVKDRNMVADIMLPASDEEIEKALEEIKLPGESLGEISYNVDISDNTGSEYIYLGNISEVANLFEIAEIVDGINDFDWEDLQVLGAITEGYGNPKSVKELKDIFDRVICGDYKFYEGATRAQVAYSIFSDQAASLDTYDMQDMLDIDYVETDYGVIYLPD